MEPPPPPLAAESFDRSAQVYEGHFAVNRAGARRLVASVPEGRYPRLLDVGCWTGFASLEAIPLHEEHYSFVASPKLLRHRPLRRSEDARAHTLIDVVAFAGYALLVGRVGWLPAG